MEQENNKKKKTGDEKKKQIGVDIGYVKDRSITQEMEDSYIDYAMSVIVGRALPDVRDGLKPVHRRILYTMREDGITHSAKYRKSASVVGTCLARYHPHGDMAVYNSLVIMAQDFSMRYPLVQGQGNFGCFTKDTEVKLTDGRNITFTDLIKERKRGKKHWTFSFNHKEKRIEIAEVEKPRITRKKASLVEVELDNGEKIRCTPDHRFMLRNGEYKEAQYLQEKESLMPLYTSKDDGEENKNLKGYTKVFQPIENDWNFVHFLADKWNLKKEKYEKKRGRVRHHIDFNKNNNNPENIQRMHWEEHWKFHSKLTSWRHQNDPEYVKKVAAGRKEFIENNAQFISERASMRNKEMWKNPDYRNAQILRLKRMWENKEYKEFMRKKSSDNLKQLWQDPKFQKLMSNYKSEEMKKRWQDPEYRKEMAVHMQNISRKIWSNPKHREFISQRMKEVSSSPAWKKRQRAIAKALWKDPSYRANFPKEHFVKMGKKLWEKEGVREMHSEKAKKQWEDADFRKKVIATIKKTGKRRIAENPNMMKEMSVKAAKSLKKKWKEKEYKERVVRNRILGHVKRIVEEHNKITPELYEKNRYRSNLPRAENALNYFKSFEEMTEKARNYNHKVVSVKFLKEKEDVYDITVRPWHNFALGSGIFVHNSVDGDPPSAQRYSEARLSKIGEAMLRDIQKETVNFIANYDGTRKEPTVLPSPVPQLLLNGSLGIAVGMATNIPPHNIGEVIDASIHLIDNPKADTEDLFCFVKGPDFPTGGEIYNKEDIVAAYSQGKGSIIIRGKAEIVEEKGKNQIIITEIPYRVRKAKLVEDFAKMVQKKKLEGVRDIRDESDREGMRIVLDLKTGSYPAKILNRLYSFSSLQETFHINMIALVDGIQPRVMGLDELLQHYIDHRKEVVTRRTKFDLEKAKERAHILEGLHKALSHIDEVIKTIKKSESRDDAQKNLMKKFDFTEVQANAILEMKLQKLAKLEREEIENELEEKRKIIKELTAILKSKKKIEDVVKKELLEMKEMFADKRKTKVYEEGLRKADDLDLIPQESTIVTITQGGYIKRVNPSTYKAQQRGGKGMLGMKTGQDDIVDHFIEAMTHDFLLFFTDSGKVFRVPVYQVPEGARATRGRGLMNFLEISSNEKVLTVIPLESQEVAQSEKDKEKEDKNLVVVTKKGVIKKTPLKEFSNIRRSGLIAITLRKNDEVCRVRKTSGKDEIAIVTKKGQIIRFGEKDVRTMGRQAGGVRGVNLRKGDEVADVAIIKKEELAKAFLLLMTENGYGKRIKVKNYRAQKRGGVGVKTVKNTEKVGGVISLRTILEEKDLIAISRKGKAIRMELKNISEQSRVTQGVRLMKMDKGDGLASIICM